MKTYVDYTTDRLWAYAMFLGSCEGVLDMLDRGYIQPDSALARISVLLAEAKTALQIEEVDA